MPTLAEQSSLNMPRVILDLLADPPILRGEDPEQYRNNLCAIAESIGARDVVQWIWAADIAYHTWQILRCQKIETQLILYQQMIIVEELLASTFDGDDTPLEPLYVIFNLKNDARKWASDSEFAKIVNARLASRGHSQASILATAHSRSAGQLQAIQKRISDFELRRMATIREIGYRDQVRAKLLEKKSQEIVDLSFSRAAE